MSFEDLKQKFLYFLNLRSEVESLEKAREESGMSPEEKTRFRSERKKFSFDPLEDQLTPEPGVSNVGIEIRRADARKPGVLVHGYGRTTTPEIHKERAKDRLKALIGRLKKNQDLKKTSAEQLERFNDHRKDFANQNFRMNVLKDDHHGEKYARMQISHDDLQHPTEMFMRHGQWKIEEKLPSAEEGKTNLKITSHKNFDSAINHLKQTTANQLADAQNKVTYSVPTINPDHDIKPETNMNPVPKMEIDNKPKGKMLVPKKLAASQDKKAQIIPDIISEPIVQNKVTRTFPKVINGPNVMIERKSEMDNTESSEIENRFESIKNVIDKLKSKNLSKAKADKKLPEHDRERIRLERKGKTFLDAFVKDKSGTPYRHLQYQKYKSNKKG